MLASASKSKSIARRFLHLTVSANGVSWFLLSGSSLGFNSRRSSNFLKELSSWICDNV